MIPSSFLLLPILSSVPIAIAAASAIAVSTIGLIVAGAAVAIAATLGATVVVMRQRRNTQAPDSYVQMDPSYQPATPAFDPPAAASEPVRGLRKTFYRWFPPTEQK